MNIITKEQLNLKAVFLPLSRGYGNVKAWHIAMSEDLVLLNLMEDIVNLSVRKI